MIVIACLLGLAGWVRKGRARTTGRQEGKAIASFFPFSFQFWVFYSFGFSLLAQPAPAFVYDSSPAQEEEKHGPALPYI